MFYSNTPHKFHSLVLVTFFTFAKNSTMCGRSQDLRIRLSKKYTFINFLVSTAASAFCIFLLTLGTKSGDVAAAVIAALSIPLIIASLLTLIFLFYDYLCCCCCGCCLGAWEWKVFDPENHQANLVWRNGEITDKDEEEDCNADNNMTLKERNLADA